MGTHYVTLGIKKSASAEDIHSAYKKLMRKNHPDMGGNAEVASSITLAYSILSNELSRSNYDRSLEPKAPRVTSSPIYNSEQPIKVAQPMEFVPEKVQRDGGRKGSMFQRAWGSTLGRIFVALALASFVTWIVGVLITLREIKGLPIGLSSFIIGLVILTAFVFFLSPIRRPTLSIIILILVFLIPIDYMHKDNLLPNLLQGVSAAAATALSLAYFSAFVTRVLWFRIRRIQ